MTFLSILLAAAAAKMGTIIGIALAGILVYGSITSRGRNVIGAVFNYFFGKVEQNPKVLEGMYDKKVRQLEDIHQQACDLYKTAAGELKSAKNEKEKLTKLYDDYVKSAITAQNNDKTQDALIFAEHAQTTETEINLINESIKHYEMITQEALKRVNIAETNVKDMKNEKKQTMETIKNSGLVNKLYDQLNHLNVNETDHSIANAKELVKSVEIKAIGAQELYKNSETAKLNEAEERLKKIGAAEYLQNLMKNKQGGK